MILHDQHAQVCGGGFGTVMMVGYTYISDVTSQADRTTRVSVLDAATILAKPLGNLLGARLFLHFGYYVVFAVSGVFSFSGALYVMLVLKETVKQHSEEKKSSLWSVLKEKNPVTIVRTIGRPRAGLRRSLVLGSVLLLLIHNLYYREGLYLYTRRKFSWDEQAFSEYTAVDTLHGFTRAVVVTPLLSKVLQVHDPMIGMMGAMSWVTCFMVWALATHGWMMYLATALSSIGGLTSTPIITLLTKLVDKEELGAVMAMSSGGSSIII